MVFNVHLIYAHAYARSWQNTSLCVPHQMKSLTKYRWHTYNRWQIALIIASSSSDLTYKMWLAYLQKIIIYITTYPPSCACAFNTARTAVHTLWERIHVLRKRPQDIPRSPRRRCVVMTSRSTDMQPLPNDRDCPQVNLILRGRVRDSHHPVGGYLPSYLVVGASLQKVDYIK
jgi:hypothetical protein